MKKGNGSRKEIVQISSLFALVGIAIGAKFF